MLRLGWLQFRYSQKIWLDAIFTFIVSGWLSGFCFIGLYSLSQVSPEVFISSHNPAPLFGSPLILGSFTLFFSIRGIIKSVINLFKRDYQLWQSLGATKVEISSLVSVQISILSTLGGSIGFLIAVGTTKVVYLTLQSWLGKIWLPTIAFHFIIPFIITIAFLNIVSVISGYAFTGKVLQRRYQNFRRKIQAGLSLILIIFLTFSLIQNTRHIFTISGTPSQILLNGGQLLISTLMYLILLQALSKNYAFKFLLASLFHLTPFKKNAYLNIAYWESTFNFNRISYTLVPVLIVETLTMGMIEILFGFSNHVDFQNALVSFLIYIFPPELIVIVNVISMTKLNFKSYHAQMSQLRLIGLTYKNLFFERILENFTYSLILFIYSVICSQFTYQLSLIISGRAHLKTFSISAMTFNLPLYTAIIVFILLSTTDFFTFKSWIRNTSSS